MKRGPTFSRCHNDAAWRGYEQSGPPLPSIDAGPQRPTGASDKKRPSRVLVRFPFSDLSQVKLRPAVVLATVGHGDRILCQLTSKPYGDSQAIKVDQKSLATGGLKITSFARPGKIFTADQSLITAEVAALKDEALKQIVEAVVDLLRTGG